MVRPIHKLLAFAALLLGIAAATAVWLWPDRAIERQPLGLMTSLPIYWPEGADMSDIVSGRVEAPWMRQELEQRFTLQPIDTLSPDGELSDAASPLAGMDNLLIVQPRGFSPADNVALDDWVRAGGHALIAVDPMLTGHYDVSIMDPRHPVVSALIPNVFAHWGLEVHFSENQPLSGREVDLDDTPLPVLMAGWFVLADEGQKQCQLKAEGTVAECSIGQGHVTLLADAAIFEHGHGEAVTSDALKALTDMAFIRNP